MEKKRYLSITLAMCLALSALAGCGGGQTPQPSQTQAAGNTKEESQQAGTAGESSNDTAEGASGETILIGVSGSITGAHALAIHGNKSQNARQLALRSFKDGTLRVLVATDIAARGIDVDELALVINYELPNVPETYVHRIGRTGRAGLEGDAISFCDFDEKPYLKDIEKLIKKAIPVVEDHPFPMEIFEPAPKPAPRPPRDKRTPQPPRQKSAVSGTAAKPALTRRG